MDKIIVRGGKPLKGTIEISGAKNAALPLMVAALLTDGKTVLNNVPTLKDVSTLVKLLEHIGVRSELKGHQLILDSSGKLTAEAPYEHVKKMRASIYVLGPLLARFQEVKVSLPGGCAWGPRPVDIHIKGMEKLGADVQIDNGYIYAKGQLKGAKIYMDKVSVGATGNLLMAAVLAKGKTVLGNSAIEPEITNLVEMLIAMGAKIKGVGTRTLEIEGVEKLNPVEFDVIPDRIEAGTYMAAAAITGGDILLKAARADQLEAVIDKMIEAGCEVEQTNGDIRVIGPKKLNAIDITTDVYPGFPTDMQAQWMAMMSVADGSSRITDTIYTDRFTHAAELTRLNADIDVVQNTAYVHGVEKLKAAPVMSTDLRASASLILAALVAEGLTEVQRVYHIDRGYQEIEKKLAGVGADIQRVHERMEFDS
ncbi:MAG: UDP-N-acetylglucosamine 1-carboxyvinyltransferase [Calditrichaeota bacterium]|nr:UDP-N-acetylglucosamine 1-carboxyvinyltransferase [Calditrichota bacterium]